jgi:uncharacterized protein (TIGR00369 family)
MIDPVAFMKNHVGERLDRSPSIYMRWLGGVLHSVERGKVSCTFTVRHEMLNPAMTIHGGVIAGIMDEMMGMCVYTLGLETIYMSVNLNVDFLESAKEGEELTASAEVIREGSRLIYGHCALKCGDRLVAMASSSLIKTPLKVPHPQAQ